MVTEKRLSALLIVLMSCSVLMSQGRVPQPTDSATTGGQKDSPQPLVQLINCIRENGNGLCTYRVVGGLGSMSISPRIEVAGGALGVSRSKPPGTFSMKLCEKDALADPIRGTCLRVAASWKSVTIYPDRRNLLPVPSELLSDTLRSVYVFVWDSPAGVFYSEPFRINRTQ